MNQVYSISDDICPKARLVFACNVSLHAVSPLASMFSKIADRRSKAFCRSQLAREEKPTTPQKAILTNTPKHQLTYKHNPDADYSLVSFPSLSEIIPICSLLCVKFRQRFLVRKLRDGHFKLHTFQQLFPRKK